VLTTLRATGVVALIEGGKLSARNSPLVATTEIR
jgi:hypothetical protein